MLALLAVAIEELRQNDDVTQWLSCLYRHVQDPSQNCISMMPCNLAAPLLIIYASLQLVIPMGGHDVLEGFGHAARRPHLHLSMIDEILGLKIAAGPHAANSFAPAEHFSAATEHDRDVVYLPSEVRVSSFPESTVGIEGLDFAWYASNQLEIALKRASSLAAHTYSPHSSVAIHFFKAIERWQI